MVKATVLGGAGGEQNLVFSVFSGVRNLVQHAIGNNKFHMNKGSLQLHMNKGRLPYKTVVDY